MAVYCRLPTCDQFLLDLGQVERVEDDFPVASQRKRPKLEG
jgi:hypothetical protein